MGMAPRHPLEDVGIQVLLAAGGDKGLAAMRERRIGVVMPDIFIPGKNRLEAIRDLRLLFPRGNVRGMSDESRGHSAISTLQTSGTPT